MNLLGLRIDAQGKEIREKGWSDESMERGPVTLEMTVTSRPHLMDGEDLFVPGTL